MSLNFPSPAVPAGWAGGVPRQGKNPPGTTERIWDKGHDREPPPFAGRVGPSKFWLFLATLGLGSNPLWVVPKFQTRIQKPVIEGPKTFSLGGGLGKGNPFAWLKAPLRGVPGSDILSPSSTWSTERPPSKLKGGDATVLKFSPRKRVPPGGVYPSPPSTRGTGKGPPIKPNRGDADCPYCPKPAMPAGRSPLRGSQGVYPESPLYLEMEGPPSKPKKGDADCP
ncbi:uncharacterized protein LOC119568955 [Penaeus monodon]|uniref:uncharacterized protein LOC119568955 n=1 Tax=Penaeus monodon TaxID=6687 RepID=UPI0018A6EDE5|nr:uncharacterized protein LOC119568955 [Penaeus monodon]